MKFLFQTLFIFLSFSASFGQIGREFWFGAPDISESFGETPASFNITALYETDVTLSKPADPSFTPIEYHLVKGEHVKILMSDLFTLISSWETAATNIIQDDGFLIESGPGEISVFYELDHTPRDREVIPLKGTSALGIEFTVSTQNILHNYRDTIPPISSYVKPFNGFVIVATEDNTNISVTRNGSRLAYFDAVPDPITLTLHRGQTYAFKLPTDEDKASEHINGVDVTSNKNIAITIYDDGLDKEGYKELFADQIIPKDYLGTQYFIQKGIGVDSVEVAFITATEDATAIYIDGVLTATIDKDSVYQYFFPSSIEAVHLTTNNKPVFVNQMVGIDNMIAGANLPSFEDCVGTYDAIFTRPGNSSDLFHMRIIAHNETSGPNKNLAADNLYMVVGNDVVGFDSTKIPAGYFEYSYDSSFIYIPEDGTIQGWFTTNINRGSQVKIYSTLNKFHCGAIMGGPGTGPKYGFFSDYQNIEPSAGIAGATYRTDTTYCTLDDIEFAARGGYEYVWTSLSNPAHINLLSDDSTSSPIFSPDTGGIYNFRVAIKSCNGTKNVDLTVRCFVMPSTVFSVSETNICSGDTVVITNTSNTSYTDKMVWNFDPPDTNITHTTVQTFNWVFPQNSTDSILDYKVTLTSYSIGEYCSNSKTRDVYVKPFVDVSIDADTNIGCAPLDIQFINNTTSGHNTDTALIYDWNLGNGKYPSSKNPATNYANNTPTDSVFTVTLSAETPYGCIDRDTMYITVLPRTHAVFSVDTNYSCSPLVVTMDPSGSLNADSLYWHFDLAGTYSDSAKDVLDPIILNYEDTSWTNGPDTLYVTLITKNSYGCIDTSNTPELIVYPNIVADFTIDDVSICDGDSILIENKSYGYDPEYQWDFGNNTFRKDTTVVAPFRKQYFNRSENDTVYHIVLTAISNICQDIMDTNLVVHPYIKAEFGYDFGNDGKNCSPVDVIIDNNSVRVDTYSWDFGDGNTSNDDSTTVIHEFINPNLYTDTSYTIRLLVSNSQGCADSLSRTVSILPQVVANFNILDDTICAPDSVRFENNSTGNNLKFYWDFGDKQTSMNDSPNFTWYYENYFDSDTNYTVELIVENNISCSDTMTSGVEVFATVESLFGVAVEEACSPFTVELDNFSSPSAKVFHWDLGSAGTSTDYIPTPPVYTNPAPNLTEDTILIELAVTGADDPIHWNTCSDTFRIPVVVYPELDVEFSIADTASCQPLVTGITNNTALTDGTTYIWELDNIFLSNKANPGTLTIQNVTSDSAVHTVTLNGSTKHNCKDVDSHKVVVYSLVDAEFSIDKEALCSYDSIYIDGTASEGGITTYKWNFNNEDSTSTPLDTAFYYSKFDNLIGSSQETKTITLTVSNLQNCLSVVSHNVLVNPNVQALFTLDAHQICYPHNSVFKNPSVNADNYKWIFGDGISSTEIEPVHEFGNFSTIVDSVYDITLIAGSKYNCYDTATDQITINAKPIADFYFPITADCPPFEAEMVNNSDGDNLTYSWDFAGEGSSSELNPSFVFSNTTNKVAKKAIILEVLSSNSCSDTMTKELTVYPNVDTNFTYDISQGCSPLTVQFNSTADPTNIQQIRWFVDDNIFANIVDPSYIFENQTADNDTFQVKFKVYSIYNCSDSAMTTITTYPSPEVNFIPDPVTMEYNTEEDQTTITISNETLFQGNWEYLWDFGDGNTSDNSGQTFSYTYGDRVWGDAEDGYKIPIVLTGWNADNPECRDSITYNIIISPPEPEIDIFEDITGCQPLTVDFSAYTKYNYDGNYYWEFNSNGATSTEESPAFTFTESGSYTVRLTIEGDGGTVSDYKIIQVLPQPVVNFSFNDTVVFVEEDEVIFYNHTTNGISYQWFFDSDNIETGTPESTEFEPIHIFQDTGLYYIGLIAESADQCQDTMIHPIPVLVLELGELEFPNAFLFHPAYISDEFSTNQGEGEGNVYLFYPKHLNVVEYHLELYNRWGTLIFETFDINQGWNGLFDGRPAQQGVYLWRARGRFANGQPFDKSGDVTLIKGNKE